MKIRNKKVEQIAAKKKHLELLKSKGRGEPDLRRAQPILIERPTILIVCEGKNTEPSYFRHFKLASATIHAIGEGYNTISLVERAVELSGSKRYDQIWCVFDADPKPGDKKRFQNFNSAVKLAKQKGFGVGYSNQAFEFWLILHFEDHQGGKLNRIEYNNKINKLLKPFGCSYDGNGNKIISPKLFELLDGIDEKTGVERKRLAAKRAEGILKHHQSKSPADAESSTTVFRLVLEIMKYVK